MPSTNRSPSSNPSDLRVTREESDNIDKTPPHEKHNLDRDNDNDGTKTNPRIWLELSEQNAIWLFKTSGDAKLPCMCFCNMFSQYFGCKQRSSGEHSFPE